MEMPILLSDAVAQLPQWALGPPKHNGQMSISRITCKAGRPIVQLLPRDRFGEIYTLFEPSVFRGTGSEPRKGIVFAAPEDVIDDIRKLEDWAKGQVASLNPVWLSAIKETEGRVKAKISPATCSVVGRYGAAELPQNWRGLPVIPIIEVRGIYSQKTGAGLILEVTHIMVGEEPIEQCDFL